MKHGLKIHPILHLPLEIYTEGINPAASPEFRSEWRNEVYLFTVERCTGCVFCCMTSNMMCKWIILVPQVTLFTELRSACVEMYSIHMCSTPLSVLLNWNVSPQEPDHGFGSFFQKKGDISSSLMLVLYCNRCCMNKVIGWASQWCSTTTSQCDDLKVWIPPGVGASLKTCNYAIKQMGD